MKRRIHSYHIPPRHRHAVIAHHQFQSCLKFANNSEAGGGGGQADIPTAQSSCFSVFGS